MGFRSIFRGAAIAALFISSAALAESGGAGAAQSVGSSSAQQQFIPQYRLLRQYGKSLTDSLSFTYYFSYLGPSPGLGYGETFNVFRDETKPSPQQMLHSMNLRYTINPRWAFGATLAGVNDTTKRARTGSYIFYGATVADNRTIYTYNENEREWFNARTYVQLPNWNFSWGYLTSQVAAELPTSNAAKEEGLRYGVVITESLGIYAPEPRISYGINLQMVRYVQRNNVLPPPFVGGLPTPLQTFLMTVGPYANYSISDRWQLATALSFDWDQRGREPITQLNANLPDRGRLAFNRLFTDSIFGHVGVFMQFLLLPMESETTVLGLDFTIRF